MNTKAKDRINQWETLQEGKLNNERIQLESLRYEILAQIAKNRFEKVFLNKR